MALNVAKFRQVHIEFWQDGFVLDLTPEEKYFYVYLMTNSKTSQCGIYELPKRIIETETGYSRETVDKLLQRFIDYDKIAYSENTKEIMMKNWIKYNFINSPKVIKCIEKELETVKEKGFVYYYMMMAKRLGYRIDTVSIDLGEELITNNNNQEEEQEEEQQLIKKKTMSADDFYQQNFGPLNSFIGESIEAWAKDLNEELVIEAMKRALVQQKKWKYAEGILKNWVNQNIHSLADVQALDKEFERRKGSSTKRPLFEQGQESKKRQSEIKPLSAEELEQMKRLEEELPY